MPQYSAGILMHRGAGKDTEVLLVHPGGPFWAKKDAGAWSIPKGLVDPDQIHGQASLMQEAVNLKFIDKPLTAQQLAELIQIPPRKK